MGFPRFILCATCTDVAVITPTATAAHKEEGVCTLQAAGRVVGC